MTISVFVKRNFYFRRINRFGIASIKHSIVAANLPFTIALPAVLLASKSGCFFQQYGKILVLTSWKILNFILKIEINL